MLDKPKRSFLNTYAAPLAGLLIDPAVIEVTVNPDGRVWVERQGSEHMVKADGLSIDKSLSESLATAIASETKGVMSAKKPILSGAIEFEGRQLRAQVIAPPVVEGGHALSFRAYSNSKVDLASVSLLHGQLVDLEEERREKASKVLKLTREGKISEAMTLCIVDRLNVMVSGGTSTGKTTFVRALLELVSPDERLITIEDAYELFPPQSNRVCMKSTRDSESETTAAKLLAASLRLRPDRIMLGEIRGDESKTFLDAINTGHSGSFTTIHADTAKTAIDRLALMVMSVGMNMAYEEVRRYCANSIDVIVQLGRKDGKRGIAEIYLPSSAAQRGAQTSAGELS